MREVLNHVHISFENPMHIVFEAAQLGRTQQRENAHEGITCSRYDKLCVGISEITG